MTTVRPAFAARARVTALFSGDGPILPHTGALPGSHAREARRAINRLLYRFDCGCRIDPNSTATHVCNRGRAA